MNRRLARTLRIVGRLCPVCLGGRLRLWAIRLDTVESGAWVPLKSCPACSAKPPMEIRTYARNRNAD